MAVLGAPIGGSLTGVTVTVSTFGVGSRSAPLLSTPPSSCTWNWKLVNGELAVGVLKAFAVGTNVSGPPTILPLLMLMNWPVVTATPPNSSVPLVGSVVIFTALNTLAGPVPTGAVSFGSLKPKSLAAMVKAFACSVPFSSIDIVLLVPVGASFTLVTLIVIVLGVTETSEPPLATPPLSCTWKVKL